MVSKCVGLTDHHSPLNAHVNRQSPIACPDGRADGELGGVAVSWQPALLCYCDKLGWMSTAGKIKCLQKPSHLLLGPYVQSAPPGSPGGRPSSRRHLLTTHNSLHHSTTVQYARAGSQAVDAQPQSPTHPDSTGAPFLARGRGKRLTTHHSPSELFFPILRKKLDVYEELSFNFANKC